MKDLLSTLLLFLFLLFSPGCGVYMAFTQPEIVDVPALETGGLPRDVVIERLGVPKTSSKNSDGTKTEIYEFYEGSESGWKIGRGVFHLLADIFTLALWEIIATPTEFGIRGDKLTAQADFDSNDNLVAFQVLGRQEKPLEEIHEEEEF